MMQVHHRERPGRFLPCDACHTQPRHIEHRGRTKRETMHYSIPSARHSLECACGRATARHATLELAEAEWGRCYTQMALALPEPATDRVVRLRQKRPREVLRG